MWRLVRELFKRFSRFKEVEAEIKVRQKFELKSRQQIWNHQLIKFNELWQFSCSNVPYYRDLQARLDLPFSFSSLEEISRKVPVLGKSEIQKDPRSFLPSRCSPGFWTGTSGSTGTPMKCYWNKEAYIESQRDKYYCQKLWNIGVWDKTANLWGYSRFFGVNFEGKIHFIKVRVLEKIRNKMAFPVDKIDQFRLRKWYGQLDQKNIQFLYALPNLVYLLAKANEDRSPPKSLKLVMVGGEPLFPQQQQLIEQVFGCQVAIEYGTIEAGLIASSYPDSRLHVCERSILLETLPTPDGLFELVLTNLRNKDFPLIRYRIGDFVKSPISIPEHGTATLGPVIGRVRDVLISESGFLINGVVLSEFFREFPDIIQYQVIQEAVDHVVVRLACWKPQPKKMKRTIQLKLARLMGPHTVIDLHEVEKMMPSPAGKHRFIINKIASEQLDTLIYAGPTSR